MKSLRVFAISQGYRVVEYSIGYDDVTVATVPVGSLKEEIEAKKLAKAMAAAPEMLELLELLEVNNALKTDTPGLALYNEMKRVIAKAKVD